MSLNLSDLFAITITVLPTDQWPLSVSSEFQFENFIVLTNLLCLVHSFEQSAFIFGHTPDSCR